MEGVLDKLGFSEYKKKAYLALVSLEQASVGEIAKKANIPSSKIYEVLNWLFESGYISVVSPKPLVYKANDPKSVLKSDVRSKISELKQIESEIDKLSTGLGVTRTGNFQIIHGRNPFYKKVKESVSKSSRSIIAIVKNFRLDYELRQLTLDFVQNGGRVRFLGPLKKADKNLIKEWKSIGVEIKNFTPDTTRFTVWDGKLATIGFKDDKEKEYFSLWIDNEYFGRILTDYFDNLWRKF